MPQPAPGAPVPRSIRVLLLVAIPRLGPDLRWWGVAASVVLITALVLGRQLFAFQDNQRLLEQLDEGLSQLHDCR